MDRGKDAHTDGKFTLSDKAALEIMKLFLTRDEDLYDRTITDVFTEEFFRSNFWLYWRTMFAFETWHSALEMKLYLQRFIHHIGGLPDFSALKFTQYNQYESLILPMVHYLKEHNVQFQYDTQVTNVIFKGTFYDTFVDVEGFKWLIQTTDVHYVGETIGISLDPDAIHIMKKSQYSGMFGDYSSFSEEYEEMSDANWEADEEESEDEK